MTKKIEFTEEQKEQNKIAKNLVRILEKGRNKVTDPQVLEELDTVKSQLVFFSSEKLVSYEN